MRPLRILQVQLRVPERTEDALLALERACALAAREGARVLALPEMFCCPYEAANFPRYAQRQGGEVWQACSALAARYGLWLSAGSVPEEDGGRIYNTAYVFDPAGRQAARHRKMHLFDIDVPGGQRFRESDTLSAGSGITVFETDFGKVGLCICYDLRFPELVRLMALQGAELILVPAAFNMTTGPAHWELTFRSQAVYNQVFLAGTSPARDMAASYHAWGHSIVVDPWGAVLSQMDERAGWRVTDLDLDRAAEIRAQLPLLRHRRTDVYDLSERTPRP